MKETVESIINNWDPIDLLAFAPKDEYSSEISQLASFVVKNQNINEIAIEIHRIFTGNFGNDIFIHDITECQKIAEIIVRTVGDK